MNSGIYQKEANNNIDILDKSVLMAQLLDIYGELLPLKQRQCLDMYYNSNLSLSEIAENEDITRQGVHDSIKRGEAFLIETEQKLGVLNRNQWYLKCLSELSESVALLEKENIDDKNGKIFNDINFIIKELIEKTEV